MTFVEALKEKNIGAYDTIKRYLQRHEKVDITIVPSEAFAGFELIDKENDKETITAFSTGLITANGINPNTIVPDLQAFHRSLRLEAVKEVVEKANKETQINPPNKCSHLYKKFDSKAMLEEIFTMQLELQKKLGKDPSTMEFMDRVNAIKDNMLHINIEFAELVERLPFKYWKKYTDQQKAGFISREHQLETWFEFIDMAHFFINIGLALGISPKVFYNLYRSKNKENFRRQKDGY